MKQKTTIMALFWLLLVYSHQVFGSPGSAPNKNESSPSGYMLAMPGPGFTYIANSGCVPVTVQFYSQLNGPAYSWTFGDGGTSSDCNPVHTYTTPGTYVVTLVATGGTYSTTITVGANPVVTLTGGDTVSCQDDTKIYTISSTIAPASYSWSAQGGNVISSTATTATVKWTSYGVNYLTYTITTPAGCTKVFRFRIKVIPPPTINLPCCDKKRDKPDGSDGKPQAIPPHGEEGVPGGAEPCSACAGSYNCYSATIDPQFGLPSDYTWNWSVTNGTIVSISADSTQACVIWGASGTGTIKLVVEHKTYHCQTIKECEVTITPGVTPSFTVSGSCVNSPVNFDATATSPISDVVSYFWEFGDGYSTTTIAPFASHQFTFTGSYTATLTITTKEGCKYKTTRNFNVISGTKPTIECPGTVCARSRECYSTENIPGATYVWTIVGDIASDRVITGNKVCVTWGNGPVGTVSVTVLGGGYTCTNSASEAVAIVSNVIPVNAPDFICQSATSLEISTANYAGACYKWVVNGIAQSETSNKLTINPSAFGDPIVVNVDVDFPIGCCHGRGQKTIKKLPQYTMLYYNVNACVGSTVTYNLTFPAGLPGIPVAWSVDGGTIISSSPTSVTIKWDVAGTGTITAGNNTPSQYCNDGSNNTWNVTVWPPAPGDDISGPAVVCGGSSNTYYHGWSYPTGSASISVSPGGASVSAGSYSSNITFPAVAAVTNYTVTVTYNHSLIPCPSTKTYVVKVLPNSVPSFSGVGGTICQGDVVTYTANIPDNVNYSWNVIGGTIISQTYSAPLLTIQVQWNSTLTSSLNITNKICNITGSQPVTVNGKPVVIITPSGPTCPSPSVNLRVAPVWSTYAWSGGGTSNTKTVITPGIYSVTVSNGVCSNTGSINVPFVNPTPPTITGFTVTPTTIPVCPKMNKICANITPGSGSITSYNWSFSGFNITSSSAACPVVALPAPGAVGTWTLTVTDSYLCTATRTGTLTETCTPVPGCSTYVATFSATYDPCTGQFTSSGSNYIAVDWVFGDGTIGSGFNPIHFYNSVCTQNVSCYVTDINNCVKVFNFPINVPFAFVSPGISVNNSACTGANSLRANGVQICASSGLVPNYFWTITPVGGGSPYSVSTGSTSTLNVASLPIPNGQYNVSVTMTVGGCSRTVNSSFNKGGLQAYFVSCGGCAGSPLSFTDQSVPYTAPIIKWQWNVSGPASYSSSLQNPTILFNTAGTYTVSLTVTDDVPCTSTFTATIVIQPPFLPGNIRVNGTPTASGTTFNICPGDNYTLTAPPGTTYSWSNGSSASSINVDGPGEYYVTVFNASNCSAKIGPIKFLYKPAPEAIILGNATACAPSFLRALTGTGYNYNWSYPVGATSTFPYINAYSSGTVSLTVTNLYGCSDVETQVINVLPSPYVSVSAAPLPFCPGNTATLTASVSGGTPPFTHLWNNGSTATAITVNTPGTYTHRVVDANGCPGNAQYNLNPATPPGMDLLPKGCYDVCSEQITFCTGRMPYGWQGQWYRDGMPYGGIIPENGNMATTFTGSGTYVLHYIPVYSWNCPAESNPIIINMSILPFFTIIPAGPPLVCNGGSLVLAADIQSPDYTYTWYEGGTVVGAGYTYTATHPGTYTLVVSKGACCSRSTSIDIGETNCCFDEGPVVPFQPILQDSTITADQFWYGKYFIDAVVTVTGSAILDLTNVDCVFGPSGTIVFTDNSFLRCNNSVLRPCEIDDIWPGLSFRDGSGGWINTTTIKNAIIGVRINSNQKGVRLTDNSFIKCQVGVRIDKSQAQQSISGNTFEIDGTFLNYPTNPYEYWGIILSDVTMDGLIAQNNFRHVQPIKDSKRYFGIYSTHATGTISENAFNDMFRAIDVSRNRDIVTIEKNEVKLNYLKETYDSYQIRVTQSDIPVLIYENRMNNGLGDNSYASAVYCEEVIRTHLKDNHINGFVEGIRAVNTTALFIASNEITSSMNTGIILENARESFISCNTIKGSNSNNYYRYGIVDLNSGGSSNIFSNCIFDMNTAMYVQGDPSQNLPPIYNNYMYNYDESGIFNRDYSGSIGNPGGATSAGRNTFMSNNGAPGSTIDINSTFPITEDGNFGVLSTNNTSTSSGPDEYYSTAACGQQIEKSYSKNELDRWNVCDLYFLDQWVYRTQGGQYALRQPTVNMDVETINKSLADQRSEIYGQVIAQVLTGGKPAQQAARALMLSNADKNLVAQILVNAFLAAGEAQSASNILATQELSGIDRDLRQILSIVIVLENNPVLTSSQLSMLTAIDEQDNAYSPMARDMIQARNGDHDYKFNKSLLPAPAKGQAGNLISRTSNTISVYPVPASEFVTVKHNVNNAKVQELKVFSAAGMEVTSFKYTVQAGNINIDISTLASGIYSVVLMTDSKTQPMMTGRFVKIK